MSEKGNFRTIKTWKPKVPMWNPQPKIVQTGGSGAAGKTVQGWQGQIETFFTKLWVTFRKLKTNLSSSSSRTSLISYIHTAVVAGATLFLYKSFYKIRWCVDGIVFNSMYLLLNQQYFVLLFISFFFQLYLWHPLTPYKETYKVQHKLKDDFAAFTLITQLFRVEFKIRAFCCSECLLSFIFLHVPSD